MNAKMIIGICLVVFIIAGLIFLKVRKGSLWFCGG